MNEDIDTTIANLKAEIDRLERLKETQGKEPPVGSIVTLVGVATADRGIAVHEADSKWLMPGYGASFSWGELVSRSAPGSVALMTFATGETLC